MKIQQVGSTPMSPSFGAKLSQSTIKALGREVEVSAKGNQTLNNVLEKLKSVGNKDTVIHIGDFYKSTEMVTIYHDEPDVEVEYSARNIGISNPLMPGIVHNYEERFVSESLLETIQKITNYGSNISSAEAILFKKYVEKTNENPLLVFESISPFLKSNKTTYTNIFDAAKSAGKNYLENITNTINAKEKEINALKAIFSEKKSECDNVIANTEKELNSENFMSEREAILDKYC